MEDGAYLNDTWSLYFHDPYDTDWTYDSYKKVCELCSANDYWSVDHALDESVAKGMFFIMREHIFPCWDDKYNIEGGCLSMKVLKQDMVEFWRHMVARLLGETLLKDDHIHLWDKVNGISTSPKKHFAIVKIWVATEELGDPLKFALPENFHGEIIYKSNRDNIACDQGGADRAKGQ